MTIRRMDSRNGRGVLRAGRAWRGRGGALLAALRILAATGARCPHCRAF